MYGKNLALCVSNTGAGRRLRPFTKQSRFSHAITRRWPRRTSARAMSTLHPHDTSSPWACSPIPIMRARRSADATNDSDAAALSFEKSM